MIEKISKIFHEHFNTPFLVVRSPGRVNIIGEHTDYNDGFVLPAAIDKAAYIAVGKRNDDKIRLIATDLGGHSETTLEHLKPATGISWPNYLLGALAQFQKRGISLSGFNMVLGSDIPIGAGLSSSAAITCAAIFGINELMQTGLDKRTMIQMAQKAEHEYAGVMCGIMDMFASMMGKKDHVIKLDCRSLAYEYVPLHTEGYKLVLLNTNVKHTLAMSAYNTRRDECLQAVEWIRKYEPGVQALRDADEEMLHKYVLPESTVIHKRSLFVVQEIQRLQQSCTYLQQGDLDALGIKMFETHEGLRKMYEVSCKELDFLVDFVRNSEAVSGARMMGGGFGGCTINLVKEDAIEAFINQLQPVYEAATGLPLTVYIAAIENGTELISPTGSHKFHSI